MTNLTEKWKNGQLKGFKWYYVKFKTGKIDVCWLTEWSNDELGTGGQYFDGIKEENIDEVLAEVPSYKEWQAKLEENARLKAIKEKTYNYDYLSECYSKFTKENAQLKELLKECEHIMSIEKDFASCHFEKDKLCKLLTKINQVLANNKIQANTVACNKIQESE